MDIFQALPSAIVTNTWELGTVKRATDIGKVFQSIGSVDVIVDEVESNGFNQAPNADYLDSDTLLFTRPDAIPSVTPAVLISDYLWHNLETDQYYEITEVGVGKNQESGVVEHIEFKIQPTGALEDGE